MKRDFDKPVLALDGTPMRTKEGDDAPIATMHDTIVQALLAPDSESKARSNPTSPDDKVKLFKLAMRLYKGGVQEVEADEITLIKQRVGMLYLPLTVGRVAEFLEKDPE